MVYTYLWTTESLESTNLFLAQDPECMRIQTRPYIIDSAYVGGEMAAEILELFYQLTSGVAGACHLEWPEQVRGVIHHDVAGLGLIAANLLRALYIRLDLEFLTTHGTRRFDVSRLEYFLARLYDIKKKEGFKLHFELQQHRIRLKQWEQGFRVLAPICRVFEAAGAEVHTSWTYRDEGWPWNRFAFSLDKFVQYPRVAWKSEVVATLHEHRNLFSNEEYNWEDGVGYDPRSLDSWYNNHVASQDPYRLDCDWRCGWFQCTLASCRRFECVLIREAERFSPEEEYIKHRYSVALLRQDARLQSNVSVRRTLQVMPVFRFRSTSK
jgi:hypothetical protein